MRKKIAVTGAGGQLAQCIQKLAPQYQWDYEFDFLDSAALDITDPQAIQEYFSTARPDVCFNCAAYTAVDLAETETEKAWAVNADGAGHIASACAEWGTSLIHISTDYVFAGDSQISYSEDNFLSPPSVYGQSKAAGEEKIMDALPGAVVIRTSWLYSEYGKNFVKTMLRLFRERDTVSVVSDQFGQPTYAPDLAEAMMLMVEQNLRHPGVFHFSNYPETTWYSFAKKIAELSHASVAVHPISTAEYPTPAKRPMRSTFDLSKIEALYKVEIKHWESSLKECLEELAENPG